ncbi:hypothetical protein [Acetobacter sp.]|uniref:hypothetical protein n=1 Tax=Acetobacter sp. TaxID=440 RepID=UPI0025C4F4BA|nr:hypothetical protein [Acetobacter sp.]MCH4091546.1 hypothetical protein [Acetobacter sp.]MCI1299524.1 hypothetical protein [Acetobacter sp.]MCI1316886.1 hypothetical protein [Acetobacter sp.]
MTFPYSKIFNASRGGYACLHHYLAPLPWFVFLLTTATSSAYADSTLQVTQINGSAVVTGTGKTLAQLASTTQKNTNSLASTTSTASSAYSLAVGAIQTSLMGVAGGLAVLDSSGNVTSPVSTTAATASDYSTVGWNDPVTWTTNSGSATQYGNPKIAFNHRWTMGYDSSGNGYVDDYMPPNHLRLGGSQEFDGVPLFVHNIPYSGGNMGIVEGVFMQSENMRGSIAGVGPSYASGAAAYDNYDAVARYTYAGPSSPVFTTTGSAITAPDGLTHIPTFYNWGATFSNPLPQQWSDWIKSHNHARMMTNEIGVNPSSYKNATFVAELTGYATNASGLVTNVQTDGWRIFNQTQNFPNTDTSTETPGTTSLDGTTPAIDTVWSDFSDPAIMFGVYTKAFDNNVICYLPGPTPHASPGDINDPTGKINNQVRSCEGIEYDLWNDDTSGETAYMQGITVAYSGTTSPSPDSYDMNLAGGNANTLVLSGEWYSMNVASHSFASAGYGGPAYSKGSQKVVADFAQSNRPGWDADTTWPAYSHDIRLTIWNTRNADDTSNQNDYNDITTSMGVQIDGHNDVHQLSMDGTTQEHLEFNPANYPNGISLCGYTGCGFSVNRQGTPEVDDNLVINGGKSLILMNASNALAGYLYASTDGNMHVLGVNGPTKSTFVIDAILKSNGAINAPSNTYSSLPTTNTSSGDQRYCSDCYSSASTSTNRGIPVWWNGSTWTDSLGVAVKN